MKFPARASVWGLFALLAITLLLFSAAYQVRRPISLDIGGPYDTPETPGFHAPQRSDDGATYRWAPGTARLFLPGIGSADLRLTLQLSSGRPANSPPLPIEVTIGGHPVEPLALSPSSAAYSFDVPAAWIEGGDLVVDFQAPTFTQAPDVRPLGFLADFARVEWRGAPVLPAPAQLFYLLGTLALLYCLLLLLGYSARATVVITGLVMLAFTGVLAIAPIFITVFSDRMAVLLLMTLVLTAVTRWLLRFTLKRLGYWAAMGERAGVVFVRGAATLFAAVMLLKVGGLLYPHTFIVDAYFHLKQLQYAIEGRLQSQEALAMSVMPADEWVSRAFIPYSPFFYVIMSKLAWLPWPIATWVPVLMGTLDAIRVPLVALVALVLAPGPRRALWATAFFAFIPATYVVQQWGNWPTQLSLWLTLVWLTVVVLGWNRSGLRGPLPRGLGAWLAWLVASVLLGLTLLSYTVTAVYVGSIFVLFALLGLWRLPRERGRMLLLLSQFLPAIIIALVGFYGQHIITVLTETLPQFTQTMESSGTLTVRDAGWIGFLNSAVGPAMRSYALDRIYLLAAIGAALAIAVALLKRRDGPSGERRRPRWTTWFLLVWLSSMPIYLFVDYYVDQALKEYWFALPAVSVLAGTWLYSLWRRRGASQLFAGTFLLLLTWSSLSLWIFRLLLHSRS